VDYRSFRGVDLNEALSRVRSSLGSDALIHSTREVSNGRGGALGRSWVEVTAAASEKKPGWPSAMPVRHTPVRTPLPPARGRTDVDKIQRELDSLRVMVEELSAARTPRDRAVARLGQAGIDGALARELCAGGKIPKKSDALLAFLAERLEQRIEIKSDPLEQPGRRVLMCVGNTGVGKTTTLAKLVARARLEFRRSVSVISLDSYRVGALEQWQRYASLLGISFFAEQNAADVRMRVADSRSDFVFIDTAGKNPSCGPEDWPVPECLNVLAAADPEVLLVMPAATRGRDAERAIDLYREARVTGIVVTKLDETPEAGGTLHAAIPNRIPFVYLCNGPRVPEDIQSATRANVVDAVLRGSVR
jgi:flagellar biosynthesis protein FlhF